MKKLLVLITTLFINFCFSQNEYKAKNGYLFKVGDTIKISSPSTLLTSGVSGTSAGEWNSIFTLKNKKLTNVNFINKKGVISKIEVLNNSAKLYLEIFNKEIYILIEEAILNYEIVLNNNNIKQLENSTSDKYDKLLKIKELLDKGVLTKEEFEIEKKKILNEN